MPETRLTSIVKSIVDALAHRAGPASSTTTLRDKSRVLVFYLEGLLTYSDTKQTPDRPALRYPTLLIVGENSKDTSSRATVTYDARIVPTKHIVHGAEVDWKQPQWDDSGGVFLKGDRCHEHSVEAGIDSRTRVVSGGGIDGLYDRSMPR